MELAPLLGEILDPPLLHFLPPANEACEGYVLTGVCLSTGGGGRVLQEGMRGRGCAWQGGVHGRQGGVHGRRGVHGRGHVWQGACMAGGHVWQGACIMGGMHGRGCVCGEGACVAGGMCAWWGGACMTGGHVWWDVCMAGEGVMHGRGRGHAWQGGVHGRYYKIRSMSGRYASYWNAFLFKSRKVPHNHWRIWGGREGRMPPPWASKFFRFHAVFGKIWRVHAPPGGFTPPPRENPGSATDNPPSKNLSTLRIFLPSFHYDNSHYTLFVSFSVVDQNSKI